MCLNHVTVTVKTEKYSNIRPSEVGNIKKKKKDRVHYINSEQENPVHVTGALNLSKKRKIAPNA